MSSRFAALIDLLHRHEDAVRRQLGEAEARRSTLRNDIAAAEARLTADGAAVPVPLRETFALHYRARRAAIAGLHAAATAIDAEIERIRIALREAHRQVTAIEELRRRDAAVAARAQQRREARENDEFAATRRQMMTPAELAAVNA